MMTFFHLGISLALGLLVGLQRERTKSHVAGIRTFALMALLGTMCAELGHVYGGWVVAAGFLSIALLFVMLNVIKARVAPVVDHGLTTEIAALLTYGVGAYLAVGDTAVAVGVGGTVALLLYWKEPLHNFVAQINADDIRAIMQFVLLSLVILPVLPNRTYGPYGVLNPFEIWMFVVLIVGIGLAGYVTYKVFGQRGGVFLLGILGGLVSSTATTVSYARRTKVALDVTNLAIVVIMVASAVAYVRFLAEVAVAAPDQFLQVAPPLACMLGVMLVLAVLPYWFLKKDGAHQPNLGNPAELKPALVFALMYAVILLASAVARQHYGHTGLYVVAVLSGLTDMDAFTLSSSRLMAEGQLRMDTVWRVILLASLVNLAFKGLVVAVLGSRALLGRITLLFLLALGAGAALLVFWPEIH